MGDDSATIASQEDLERFATRAPAERQLTEPLKGVLAETALTGKNRYPFSLVKPVVELLLEQTLREYERKEAAEGEGPAPPVLDGESLPETLSRFRTLLQGFTKAPWTIQRLCEILLNPTRQYRKLHKLALAIEKCLMVTGEVGVTPRMPPPPRLSALQHVNDNSKCHDPQPAPHAPDRSRRASSSSGGMQDPDAEDSAAFTSALIDVRGMPPTSSLHGASTSSNGPHHGPHHAPHSQHHPHQQQQQQQGSHATTNNGHAQASHFAQFHTQQQQQQVHHAHGNHVSSEGEDERWPQNQQHTFLASMLGHQHQQHAAHEAAHSPPATLSHPQQQQGASPQGASSDKPTEDAAANAAAAAAAVIGEGMEVETPAGVSATDQQQQGGAAVAAAEAAARAVVEGLGGAMDASTSSGGAENAGGASAGGAQAGGAHAGGDGSGGSPAAGVCGEGPADRDRVPQTPPEKPLHERMDEH